MAEQIVTVNNLRGIHLRPSCLIATEIRKSGMRVDVARGLNGRLVRADAPTTILSMALLPGDTVRVVVPEEQGAMALQVCQHIAELFEKTYDFK